MRGYLYPDDNAGPDTISDLCHRQERAGPGAGGAGPKRLCWDLARTDLCVSSWRGGTKHFITSARALGPDCLGWSPAPPPAELDKLLLHLSLLHQMGTAVTSKSNEEVPKFELNICKAQKKYWYSLAPCKCYRAAC